MKIFLIILGLHPVSGAPLPVAQGPYASVEECQQGWAKFYKDASESGLPGHLFNGVCLQWNEAKPSADQPKADAKKEWDL